MKTAKTLWIIRGLPGCGKSFAASRIVVQEGFSVAADDFPGLYEGGYQSSLQKASHKWCLEQVENACANSITNVAVANTFAKKVYIHPYLELAKKYKYRVNILEAEAALDENGVQEKSLHNPPTKVVEGMRNGWESINSPDEKGITPSAIAHELKDILLPDILILDRDGTLVITKSGRIFPETHDDMQINPAITKAINDLYNPKSKFKVYIASNQRGIQDNHKTLELLEAETRNLFWLCQKQDWYLDQVYYAPERNSNKVIVFGYEDVLWFEERRLTTITDKPGTGIFEDICKDNNSNISAPKQVWIVGDSHNPKCDDDWKFAIACKGMYENVVVRYIPVELLEIAVRVSSSS